jgi:UDP-4-amino-4-deoxy-L-arabinose formyltransferase/UDP-glucuronic acid dehydrogenase (UDP-4-keto-hexauronic acid decarboxylating)
MLVASRHAVIAVVTGKAGGTAAGATVAGLAARLDYRTWPAAQSREPDFADVVRRERVDLLLNVNGPHILPEAVVSAPLIGSFNLHPGPLPAYAGLNAPSWAIYLGERTHAATWHWMDAGIDTGPLAYTAEFPVDPDETGLTLTGKCIRAGLPLLHDLLAGAARQSIPRRPQPSGVRRYYGREVPHEGRLFWTESAERVVSFIRACDYLPFPSPWRAPRAYLAGREIAILKAILTNEPSDAAPGTVGRKLGREILVSARDQWVQVQWVRVGSSVLPAAEALRPGEQFALPGPHEPIPATR